MTPAAPKLYNGAVAFVDGVHYPVKKGEANLERPLRWDPDSGSYRDAESDEPLHNDVHRQNELALEVGGES